MPKKNGHRTVGIGIGHRIVRVKKLEKAGFDYWYASPDVAFNSGVSCYANGAKKRSNSTVLNRESFSGPAKLANFRVNYLEYSAQKSIYKMLYLNVESAKAAALGLYQMFGVTKKYNY